MASRREKLLDLVKYEEYSCAKRAIFELHKLMTTEEFAEFWVNNTKLRDDIWKRCKEENEWCRIHAGPDGGKLDDWSDLFSLK